MKECEAFQQDVFLQQTGELSEPESAELQQHLLSCSVCAEEAHGVLNLLKHHEREVVRVPDYLFNNIESNSKIDSGSGYWLKTIATAACLFIMMSIWQSYDLSNESILTKNQVELKTLQVIQALEDTEMFKTRSQMHLLLSHAEIDARNKIHYDPMHRLRRKVDQLKNLKSILRSY